MSLTTINPILVEGDAIYFIPSNTIEEDIVSSSINPSGLINEPPMTEPKESEKIGKSHPKRPAFLSFSDNVGRYSCSLIDAIGEDEHASGHWFQLGKSVYGFSIMKLLYYEIESTRFEDDGNDYDDYKYEDKKKAHFEEKENLSVDSKKIASIEHYSNEKSFPNTPYSLKQKILIVMMPLGYILMMPCAAAGGAISAAFMIACGAPTLLLVALYFIKYVQHTFVVGGIQGVIIVLFWNSLSTIAGGPLCEPDANLVFVSCVIGIYLLSVFPDLVDVYQEFNIVYYGHLAFTVSTIDGKARITKLTPSRYARYLALSITFYEFLVWVSVLLLGVHYILTIEDVGDVVQAAVALSFINQIDNMALFIFGTNGEKLETDHFRCKGKVINLFGSRNFMENAPLTISDVLTPILVGISFAAVYGANAIIC